MSRGYFIVITVLIFMIVSVEAVEATNTSGGHESDISIQFKNKMKEPTDSDSQKKPSPLRDSNVIIDEINSQQLPKTGELVNSLIIILVGIILAIMALGIITLQKIKK